MTKLSVAGAEWFLRDETRAIFNCINRDGFEARAVGGAVRNTFLGEPVHEVDFATTARPEDTLRLASEAGIRTVPTGISHGTVTLIVNSTPFEVTTLRRDMETDGRHAVVAFGDDWTEDAKRRDFTINALFAGSGGEVYDPLGGAADLFARRVRFVGDARNRIKEDYLRILRFVRFSAQYGEGAFDADGVSASIAARFGLERLSRERIRSEILRILVARRAVDAIAIMDESGVLGLLLGGIARRARFNSLCSLEAALGLAPDAILRLAALGVFIEEDAQRLTEKLRLSSQEATLLARFAKNGHRLDEPRTESLKAALYQLGPRLYLGHVLLAWASSGAPAGDVAWKKAAQLPQSWQVPKFPVGGADLIAMGWRRGADLGNTLKSLEEEWIASDFALSRDDLLQRIAGRRPG